MVRASVSVVIPAYNAAQTIGATLQSVTAQTYRDFEVIVVDDGSTDQTAAVAESFADRLPGFKLIRQPNGMVARARNTGIEVARSTFVAPLDADDLWHPRYLEKMVAALEAAGPTTVMAHAPFRAIDDDGNATSTTAAPRVDGWAMHRMLVRNFVANGSGIVFRRTAGAAAGNYDVENPVVADFLLQARLCRLGPIITVPEYLVGYRQSSQSMSRDVTGEAEAVHRAYATLRTEASQNARAAMRRGYAGYMGYYARALLRKQPPYAARLLARAVLADPLSVVERVLRNRWSRPHVWHPPGTPFLSLDTRVPTLLEPGDPMLRREFIWAQKLDEACGRERTAA